MGHVSTQELQQMMHTQLRIEGEFGIKALPFAILMLADLAVRHGMSLEQCCGLLATSYQQSCAAMD